MIQIRPQAGDRRQYAPDRDVAHVFPGMIASGLELLVNAAWWPANDVKGKLGTSDQDVVAVAEAIMRFTEAVHDSTVFDMPAALEKSGWLACDTGAKVLFLACLGYAVQCMYFHGARAADLDDPGTARRKAVAELAKLVRSVASGGLAGETPESR